MEAAEHEDIAQGLLRKLEAAGAPGLTKSRLIPKPGTKAGKLATGVLKELERSGRIGNLGIPTRPRYVVRQHYRPLELAYEHIQAKSAGAQPRLFIKTELEKGLKGPMKAAFGRALDLLVSEGVLLRLKRGNATLYLNRNSLPPGPPQQEQLAAHAHDDARTPLLQDAQPPPLDDALVIEAYRRVVWRKGLADIFIAELRDALDVPLPALHAWLLDASTRGHAAISLGDWSLAPPAAREAALSLQGRPHLQVRLT